MMRNKPISMMQKTYDECFLTCSTAVFFEGQNNEEEALRSWRSALDQINYHNAYRLSSSYTPKSETEKALYESLKLLEMQCKERVDLLEALKQSRKDAEKAAKDAAKAAKKDSMRRKFGRLKSTDSLPEPPGAPIGWLGDDSTPPMQFSELPNAVPSLPPRPGMSSSSTSEVGMKARAYSTPQLHTSNLGAPPTLPVPQKPVSRSPSPDPNRKALRTTLRSEKKGLRQPRSIQNRRPEPLKAAGLAWDATPQASTSSVARPESNPTIEARLSATAARRSIDSSTHPDEQRRDEQVRMPDPQDYIPTNHWRDTSDPFADQQPISRMMDNLSFDPRAPAASTTDYLIDLESPPMPPLHSTLPKIVKTRTRSPPRLPKPPEITYRKEYRPPPSKVQSPMVNKLSQNTNMQPDLKRASVISRKPVPTSSGAETELKRRSPRPQTIQTTSESEGEAQRKIPDRHKRPRPERKESSKVITPPSTEGEPPEDDSESAWDKKAAHLLKNLPKGVDENAARQILNEIVVKGDEVHWEDVAGLDGAKKALKEAVVYPFLRPDLFMGLREPARGMLLFGPPGTGKTMLARAVATESKSTFFAISASSLTSKWHGDSEKLVRALFSLAKVLAPSIIFVDEIDSLLSARSGSTEHEASRRSKTEFLIQWSDLQRAAAGRDTKAEAGDPSRVLVLAASNCPWDIDDAARRRFVRRQYIPLPEADTRDQQLRTLLGHQKHDLSAQDIWGLVGLTDGYSGSDITALAKDAAMGPLRNLGEALLYTPMDQIRPISMEDFEASLESIRPSVSKKGLEEFEEWAKEFGERGG